MKLGAGAGAGAGAVAGAGAGGGARSRTGGGAGRFRFVKGGKERCGVRRADPEHITIQIEDHTFSMPDVVD